MCVCGEQQTESLLTSPLLLRSDQQCSYSLFAPFLRQQHAPLSPSFLLWCLRPTIIVLSFTLSFHSHTRPLCPRLFSARYLHSISPPARRRWMWLPMPSCSPVLSAVPQWKPHQDTRRQCVHAAVPSSEQERMRTSAKNTISWLQEWLMTHVTVISPLASYRLYRILSCPLIVTVERKYLTWI